MDILRAIEANKTKAVANLDEKSEIKFIFEPGDMQRMGEFTFSEVASLNWAVVDDMDVSVNVLKLKRAFLKHGNIDTFAEFLSDVRRH